VDANYACAVNNTTPVGLYSANGYGLYDMTGNVREWNEAVTVSQRVLRGGQWRADEFPLRSSTQEDLSPMMGYRGSGFRIARPIPGPASAVLLVASTPMLAGCRRAHRSP